MSLLYRFDFRIPFTPWTLALQPPTAWQRGFWVDRVGDRCTVAGLGGLLLYVEQRGYGPLLSW